MDTPLGPYPTEPLPKGPFGVNSKWGRWFSKVSRLLGYRQSGTVTFAALPTATVTFARAEVDTAYILTLGGNSNETFWWTAKTANGFIAHSSNAASIAILNYEVSR